MPLACAMWRASKRVRPNMPVSNAQWVKQAGSLNRKLLKRYERRTWISLNMSVIVIACLSDSPPKSFCCFWCLKMCRQRKVNTDIVPLNKRAPPLHKQRLLAWRCLFIRWLYRHFAHLVACVWTCVHACCTSVFVKSVKRQRGEDGVEFRWGCVDPSQQREQCTGLKFWQPSVLRSWMLACKYFFSQALCQQS